MCPKSRTSVFHSVAVADLCVLLLVLSLARSLSTLTPPTGWRQSNVSGFGTPDNSAISALAVFDDFLYAGTWNDAGSQVWRTRDGQSWQPFAATWSSSNIEVQAAMPFRSHLYFGTGREGGGEIWRTNGTAWQNVASGGLGDSNNYGFSAFASFSDALYVATANLPPAIGGTGQGVEIWRSTTGNAGSWNQVNSDGFGAGPTWPEVTMGVFDGYLYVGLSRVVVPSAWSAELWRSPDGTTWNPVFTDGLGNPANTYVCAMEEFEGGLYIGLRNASGGQVWRSGDGLSWVPVFTDGLGNQANSRPYGLISFDDRLYVVFSNVNTGAEVWQTDDGHAWHQVSSGGWGDSNNGFAAYFDKGATVFDGSLYIGTVNDLNGGEIWQRLHQTYLPLVLRQ